MQEGWATGDRVAGRFEVVAGLPDGWARAKVGEGGEVLLARVPAVRATARLARRVQSAVAPGLVPPWPPEADVWTEIERVPLEEANTALDRLRAGDIRGAAVLEVKSSPA